MSKEQWTIIDNYFADLFISEDSALTKALEDSEKAGLNPVNVAPNQGKLLHLLTKIQGAKRILEIGTLGGYSTIWMAQALPEDGKIITLEIDPQCAEVAQNNIDRAGEGNKVEIRLGSALDSLKQLHENEAEPFDIIFIDADKENNPGYFEWSMKLSKPGSLIIADNVIRKGAVIDSDSDDPSVQGVRRFNDMVAAEPRVSTTVIQTVGSKGYDGIALILVTSE